MVDRAYRLCGGLGNFRPARGQGYGVWAIGFGGVRTAMRKFRGFGCVLRHRFFLGNRPIFELVMGQECG
ncbi:hypothetical protein D0A34_02230 [Microcoleus vaginatus PCC 9802]|jgi:hypothetical protein|uniref:hypothetical protein n=1 Tax=Microcoleus vaginatus TaxID=119532 RepID=UPI00020D179A|nr:hypothetical protein MicvaDRAFT_4717 [Microcoleus vaginatus FGP-2]UNU17837.1 hypothetical protein D0A34_02230 [Microcoleus vaginatus PCC 9802]